MTEMELARGAMRKVSWRILPLLGLGYLIAYIDRVNVSFAALQMNADIGLSASAYGFGAGVFFLSYAIFEVPSNLLCMRFGARRWIARIMICWGLVAAGMMFVRTPLEFYLARFLLGMAEAGFIPAVIYYLSGWFPKRYRGRAITRLYLAAPISGMLLGSAAGLLLSLDGLLGLRGWQWLFLTTGLPAVVSGILVLCFLPDSLGEASWLNDEERSWIDLELTREAEAIGEPATHNPLSALVNPVVLKLGIAGFLTLGAHMSLLLFVPQLLKAETGLDTTHVGWLISAGYVLAILAFILCGIISDRLADRFPVLIASIAVVAVAYLTIALGLGSSATIVVLAYLVWMFAFPFLSGSSISLWPDLLHPRQLAVGGAAINSLGQLAGFVAPFAWGAAQDASGSDHLGLYGLAAATLLALLPIISLMNKARAVKARD